MKLEYLYIDGYKGLKRLKLQFKEQTGVVPVDFLIGCNGSGKSSVLEAVGLIFTRIMQNELPGFIFELKYRMPDGTGIYVKPQKKGFCDASGRRRKLYVELEKNGKKLYAVGNRTYEKAVKFGKKYGIGKVYTDYNEMFTDPEVDVIYITTPHNTHIRFMKKAIENGKHILVEKSITLNSGELDEALEMAQEKGVIVAEAMTIFHMPVYKKLREILDSGKLGKVNLITMNFGSFKEYNMENRFFNRNLAGGAMLDIGVYALSFIRWFMDSKPDQLLSQMKAAPTGVDEQAGLLLSNKEGQMATVMLSMHSKQPKRGMVSCEKGYIEVMEYPRAWEAKIVDAESGEVQVIKAGVHEDALYTNL